jgi:ABC-2 type transport system ATP-binding protein
MLQKLLLALALAARVPALLLDEPTANLDPQARKEFLRALAAVPRETTVLLASHRLADVEAVADRVLVLHQGRLAFDGRLTDLWTESSSMDELLETALGLSGPELPGGR